MKARYQSFVAAVERAIDDADPIGLLEGGAPADEYRSDRNNRSQGRERSER